MTWSDTTADVAEGPPPASKISPLSPLSEELVAELRRHVLTWLSDESELTAAERLELRFWMPSEAAQRRALFRYLIEPMQSVLQPVPSSAQRSEIIDSTLKTLREALSFRVANEVSRIFDCGFFPDAFGRRLGLDFSVAGWNRGDGRPLVFANMATADADALSQAWSLGDRGPHHANLCLLWYVRLMEYVNQVVLPERSKKCGREVISLHLVLLGSYGSETARFTQLCRPVSLVFLQGMLKIGSLLYPDIAETVWVWRPPWIASRIYRLISPMVDPVVLAKTVFLNDEQCEKDLLSCLDSAPSCLGGTVSDSCMERDFVLPKVTQRAMHRDVTGGSPASTQSGCSSSISSSEDDVDTEEIDCRRIFRL
jgi:hypothetical protein